MEPTFTHCTVMLNEAVQALCVRPDGHYVDATFGRGGHSQLILAQLSQQGHLTVFDKDPQAIAVAAGLAQKDSRLSVRHQGFCDLSQLPESSIDGVLMDLGVSSPQIDDPARGFSFRHDGPLDMRMNPEQGMSCLLYTSDAADE